MEKKIRIDIFRDEEKITQFIMTEERVRFYQNYEGRDCLRDMIEFRLIDAGYFGGWHYKLVDDVVKVNQKGEEKYIQRQAILKKLYEILFWEYGNEPKRQKTANIVLDLLSGADEITL